ncbi:MAG: phosphoribosylaminoimidazolesuccinocarboxamide synthase [Chitinophagaceae bacterium]|nr:phosphoribosylaminoimidazolesuccinocarboxamide synthase [Chitinophagaceae bacterium]
MTFLFPGQTSFYRGKVRDVYSIRKKWLVLIASDRISAFDVILPRPIPFKGQVLNQIAASMLKATSDICPNWFIETPAPQASIGYQCVPFKIEMVVRATLTGHAWRTYKAGKRTLAGAALPDGLQENDFLPQPIITPSTKAAQGHDEDISPDEILKQGLATEKEWETLCRYSLALFERGRQMAARRGLILADTKYEFGKRGDEILLIDEVHTPDSSRYFYADGYMERQQRGEKQKQLSKEFVREWLMEHQFMGKEGQKVPEMTDEIVHSITRRYIELYEKLTGETFVPQTLTDKELYKKILASLKKLDDTIQ